MTSIFIFMFNFDLHFILAKFDLNAFFTLGVKLRSLYCHRTLNQGLSKNQEVSSTTCTVVSGHNWANFGFFKIFTISFIHNFYRLYVTTTTLL